MSYNEYSSTRGYCNCNKPPILPDKTINLQRAVDNGNRLQGVVPTQSQLIQYDNGNVVWSDLVVPTLQQVLAQGNIATDKTIELDSSNNIITTIAHNKITIDNSIDTNELTATNQTFTDVSNNTTVLNATSITIDGIGIFSATSKDITIENGTNSIVISNGSGTKSLGIRINGNIICPEYAYFLTHTPSVIPTISSATPFKITFYNNGVDILDNFVQNPNLFTSSFKTTAIYDYSGYLVVGTEAGECFYWSGSAWNKFADFNGPITSFAKSTFNNYLYIGGSFTSQDYGTVFFCNNIAVCSSGWNCFAVTNSNTGALGLNGKVNCLTESYSYTNLLFVGGDFTSDGSVAFYRFAILDFNSALYNNPYFRSIDFSHGPSGGFDGPVNTISSYSNYVFIGGAFTTATAYPLGGSEVDNYPYGVLWQHDTAGNSSTTPAFLNIGGSTGISKEVTCSYFNPGNSRFCLGFNGLSATFNNYLEFFYSSPGTLLSSFSPSSEITSIYVNYDGTYSVYFADIDGNVYRNGVLFGDSSTRGNQAITLSSQFSKICFATTLDTTDYGFYIWSLSNNIIYCNFPSPPISILYNGAPTNVTGITMSQKGSYFSMYWDGANYQYSNQNYGTFIYI